MQYFIGRDVHTRNQVVAWIEEETGEIRKRRLEHAGNPGNPGNPGQARYYLFPVAILQGS